MNLLRIAARVASRRYSIVTMGPFPTVTLLDTKTSKTGHIMQKWSVEANGKKMTVQTLTSDGGHFELKSPDFAVTIEDQPYQIRDILLKIVGGPAEPANQGESILLDSDWVKQAGLQAPTPVGGGEGDMSFTGELRPAALRRREHLR